MDDHTCGDDDKTPISTFFIMVPAPCATESDYAVTVTLSVCPSSFHKLPQHETDIKPYPIALRRVWR